MAWGVPEGWGQLQPRWQGSPAAAQGSVSWGERAQLCILGSTVCVVLQLAAPAWSLTSRWALGESFHCSVTQCPHLSNGNDTGTAS